MFSSSSHRWIPHLPTVTPAHALTSTVSEDILNSLVSYAEECQVTLATLCFATFCAFIYEMTNFWENDIGITYTMTSRPAEPEAAHLIGPFMYLPLLKIHLNDGGRTTFRQLVKSAHSVIGTGYRHVKATNTLPDTIDFEHLPPDACTRYPEIFPIAGVQFDIEEDNYVILDDANNIRLEKVKNKVDGFPEEAWWRVATNDYWITLFHYDPTSEQLRYVTVLPTTLFEYSTAVSTCMNSKR